MIIVIVRFIVLFLFATLGSEVAHAGAHHEMVARPATTTAERDQTNIAANQYLPRYVRNRTLLI
jgi:hypothetical protein